MTGRSAPWGWHRSCRRIASCGAVCGGVLEKESAEKGRVAVSLEPRIHLAELAAVAISTQQNIASLGAILLGARVFEEELWWFSEKAAQAFLRNVRHGDAVILPRVFEHVCDVKRRELKLTAMSENPTQHTAWGMQRGYREPLPGPGTQGPDDTKAAFVQPGTLPHGGRWITFRAAKNMHPVCAGVS